MKNYENEYYELYRQLGKEVIMWDSRRKEPIV